MIYGGRLCRTLLRQVNKCRISKLHYDVFMPNLGAVLLLRETIAAQRAVVEHGVRQISLHTDENRKHCCGISRISNAYTQNVGRERLPKLPNSTESAGESIIPKT